ncbi:MAG TPA: class I tRNA ligase family protein, partial [Candidatus Hodarchaeales archaeon]|nr:class I tRNA ligase family protein [Candidatus Hodarchaeales archaeon]
ENIAEYDPLNIIAKFGADALRYTLVTNSVPGLDMNLDLRRVEAARRFCQKIWQATRFVLGNVRDDDTPQKFNAELLLKLQIPDEWILSRLQNVIKHVGESMEAYKYLEGGREIYNFFWNEFCDWYIESCKYRLDKSDSRSITLAVLFFVLESSLRLLHPIMPFITEKLWQALPDQIKDETALIIASWPEIDTTMINESSESKFDQLMGIIKGIRAIRGEFRIDTSKALPVTIIAKKIPDVLQSCRTEFISLARLDPERLEISKVQSKTRNVQSAHFIIGDVNVYISLPGLVDFPSEKDRTTKELVKITSQLEQLNGKLSSEFIEKAARNAVEREEQRQKELQDKVSQLKNKLKILEGGEEGS